MRPMKSSDYPTARIKSGEAAAKAYLSRPPKKHSREMQWISTAFAQLKDVQTVLDAPCGVGRASIWLAGQGYRTTGIDLGDAAVETSIEQAQRAGVAATFEKQDVFHTTYGDQSFDAVLCFRLIHHFQSLELQHDLIREICRVSKRYVVLSYVSGCSFTSLRRKLRYHLKGTEIKQYPSRLADLDRTFAQHGFRRLGHAHHAPLVDSLQLVMYQRS